VSWKSDLVACTVAIEHEGKPTPQEVFDQCGQKIYDQWIESKPCSQVNDSSNVSICPGFYLMRIGSHEDRKVIQVDLPLPVVQINLTGCESSLTNDPCKGTPALKFTATEPLPNEQIISIQGDVGGKCSAAREVSVRFHFCLPALRV